jgi:hypothetical protein
MASDEWLTPFFQHSVVSLYIASFVEVEPGLIARIFKAIRAIVSARIRLFQEETAVSKGKVLISDR